jgi:hypothetical protein
MLHYFVKWVAIKYILLLYIVKKIYCGLYFVIISCNFFLFLYLIKKNILLVNLLKNKTVMIDNKTVFFPLISFLFYFY